MRGVAAMAVSGDATNFISLRMSLTSGLSTMRLAFDDDEDDSDDDGGGGLKLIFGG